MFPQPYGVVAEAHVAYTRHDELSQIRLPPAEAADIVRPVAADGRLQTERPNDRQTFPKQYWLS